MRTGGFSKAPSLMGKSGANERNESSLSYCRVQPTFSMRKRGLGKAVEPSLMVKKDGLILEKT